MANAKIVDGTIKTISGSLINLIAGMKLFGKHTRQSGNAVTDFGRRIKNLVAAAFVFNVIRRGLTALRNYLGGLLKTNAEFAVSL